MVGIIVVIAIFVAMCINVGPTPKPKPGEAMRKFAASMDNFDKFR